VRLRRGKGSKPPAEPTRHRPQRRVRLALARTFREANKTPRPYFPRPHFPRPGASGDAYEADLEQLGRPGVPRFPPQRDRTGISYLWISLRTVSRSTPVRSTI
jgi:hypothetical protein